MVTMPVMRRGRFRRRIRAVRLPSRLEESLLLLLVREGPQPRHGGQEQDHRDGKQHGVTAHAADATRTPLAAQGASDAKRLFLQSVVGNRRDFAPGLPSLFDEDPDTVLVRYKWWFFW